MSKREKSKNAQVFRKYQKMCLRNIRLPPLSTDCRWYIDLWDEFSKCKSSDKKDEQEIDEVMDVADDNNSNDETHDFNTRKFN